MGQDQHRARISAIVAGWEKNIEGAIGGHQPELAMIDEDYLRAQIATPEGAKAFVEEARSVRWLEWADNLPEFKELFTTAAELSGPASMLANWYVNRFVTDPNLSGAAMQSLRKHQQRLHPGMIQRLGFAIHELDERGSEAAQKWRVILATSIQHGSAPASLIPLLPFKADAKHPHSALVRRALTPTLNLRSSFALLWRSTTDWPHAELAWPLDAYYMKELIETWIESPEGTERVKLEALEVALLNAYELYFAYNGDSSTDQLALTRFAIEASDDNRHSEAIDAIIDGLRDLGARTRGMSPPLYERWWAHGFDLFRRLALHLLVNSPNLGPDEKIVWVLGKDLLHDRRVRHETFRVLRASIPDASPETRELLLSAVLKGDPEMPEPDDSQLPLKLHGAHKLLASLARSDPNWQEASVELAKLEREHPGLFQKRESEVDDRDLAGSVEELRAHAKNDPKSALVLIGVESEGVAQHVEPFYGRQQELISGIAAEYPQDALALFDAAEFQNASDESKMSLCAAFVRGWAKAELGSAAVEVLKRVATVAPQPSVVEAATDFLLEQSRLRLDEADSGFSDESRDLALQIWQLHRGSFSAPPGVDPSSLALNTWPGDLVNFWIAQIRRRWRVEGEGWEGFNAQEEEALADLLAGPADALEAIRPAFGAELYFFDAADSSFTDKHILPLFTDPASLRQVWEPFLFHPRVSSRLLKEGFLKALVSLFEHLDSLDLSRVEGQLESLAANIVNFAPITQHDRQDILDAVVIAQDGAHAAGFAGAVVEQLAKNPAQAQAAWTSWLYEHMLQRLEGVPRNPKKEELAQWANIVPALGDRIPEAAALFSGRQIGLGESRSTFDIPEDVLKEHESDLASFYAERVRNSKPEDPFAFYRVGELIKSIQSAVGDHAAKPVIEAAQEAGLLR